MKTNRVIIIASGINGLGAVRSANDAGLETVVVLMNRKELASYSRFSKNRFVLPDSPTKKDLLEVLLLISRQCGKASIVCCSDIAAEWVSELADEISKHHFMIKISPDIVNQLNDKKQECAVMAQGGVQIPESFLDLRSDVITEYPILIKPRLHSDYAILGAKNLVASSRDELEHFKTKFKTHLGRFIAQEIIEGEDDNLWVCNVSFDRNSELVSFFSFQRLGTMPSHYGVTSMALSQFNSELLNECRKIGKAISYVGPAMIEFKRCTVRDKYFYIETNPRIGMCNWFDTQCGVNNIYYSHLIAQGLSSSTLPAQHENKLFLNLTGDLMARAEDRENPISIVKLYSRHIFKKKVGATMYWSDPAPGLHYSFKTLASFISRVFNLAVKRFKGSDSTEDSEASKENLNVLNK